MMKSSKSRPAPLAHLYTCGRDCTSGALTGLQFRRNGHQNGDAKADKAAKKMHLITFYPMLAARENGVTIPDVRVPSFTFTFVPSVSPHFEL
jgi:hypothetical protein